MKQHLLGLSLLLLIAAVPLCAEEIRPGVLRTPDARFANLPDYNFDPHYQEVNGYRVHYLDEGPRDGQVILLLHGEPTWSYLYRKMIPVLVDAGYRTVAPDLIGFGRSDKPTDMATHTYAFHVDAITRFVKQLELQNMTLFGQDWGGLIGLRVLAENEALFARVVVGNSGLPIGRAPSLEALPKDSAFVRWKLQNQAMIDRGDIPTGQLVARAVGDPSTVAAYDAPFPDPSYKAGALIMPQRVPMFQDDPANEANRKAWEVLRKFEKPFLTTFSDGDPVTRGGEVPFQNSIPGAKGQKHTTIMGAGHFLQEQKGPELAKVIAQFIRANPLPQNTQAGGSQMVMADDIPVAKTPPGYWDTMPPPVLGDCAEPLSENAIDMRGHWKVVESTANGQPSERQLGQIQRIEQCGNRVIVASSGVTHDMRCDGTYENGVNDIGARALGGRKISVAATFEDGVHILRPKGMPQMTVERELKDGDLIWRYGPTAVLRLERVDEH